MHYKGVKNISLIIVHILRLKLIYLKKKVSSIFINVIHYN